MKTYLCRAAFPGALVLGAALAAIAQQPPLIGHSPQTAVTALPAKSSAKLIVTSPSFKEGDEIPWENTQFKGNIFPGLAWTKGPAGTQSYVVVVQGQRPGGNGGTSIHLTLFNIPASVTKLDVGMAVPPPAGSTYGSNVHGLNEAYNGPHNANNAYHYQVLALDTILPLDKTTDYDPMIAAMTGHVLASGELVAPTGKVPPEPKNKAAGATPPAPRAQ